MQGADQGLAEHSRRQLARPAWPLRVLQGPHLDPLPLVELATAALSAAVAWHFGFTLNAACALGVTWVLVALTASTWTISCCRMT